MSQDIADGWTHGSWVQTLDVQRDFAKQLVGVSVPVTDRVREQTESVSHAVREQAETGDVDELRELLIQDDQK